jgi:hypothetical protein
MKVYEYLSAGLPVVATPLPALAGLTEIAFASDALGTAEQLELELAGDSPAHRAERSRRAAAHSWDARLDEIGGAVAATESR